MSSDASEQYGELMEDLAERREASGGALLPREEAAFASALGYWWDKMNADEREAAEEKWGARAPGRR